MVDDGGDDDDGDDTSGFLLSLVTLWSPYVVLDS